MKEKAFVSVVLYAHNNGARIGKFLVDLDSFIDSHFENFEIIIVDDNSTDDTVEQVRKTFPSLTKDVTIVRLAWKHGSESGIVSGVDLAIGDFVIEMDLNKTDYSFDLLSELFQQATQGYDIVSARRAKGAKLGDVLFFKIFNIVTYLPFNVINESVRIVSRRAINSILDMDERIIYRSIMYRFSGFPSKTNTYLPEKNAGYRGLSLREKSRLAIDVLVSYSNIGANVSVLFAIIFALISFLLGMYSVVVYFTCKGVVQGWTTTILFMSICFFGIFLVMGLQGRYIAMITNDIKKRPTYIVKTIERSSKQNLGPK